MNTATGPGQPWRRGWRDAAAILWSAFLIAAAASVVVFGLFDPLELISIASVPLPASRMAGYATGFFFLWTMCALAAAMAIFMLRSYQRRPR